jgi:N-acetylneuraminate synthase
MNINGRNIINKGRAYIIAEISANHNKSYDRAVEIIYAAKNAGADAIKIQTYTADTITLKSDKSFFKIEGTLWNGRTLHDLYKEAFTPWEWQPNLKKVAESLGIDFFSSPFDLTAVDFLESINICAYKIASPEINDIPLLRAVGATKKPVFMSTGMATLSEIEEAVNALRSSGANQLILLKCTSAYPAPPEEMNLSTIPHMSECFGVPVGLSDHSMNSAVPVVAVALGACAIEKHLTLARSDGGEDSGFSLEPNEFKDMVDAVRVAEAAIGKVSYEPSSSETIARLYRRSLFAVSDIKSGELITMKNIKSIRPGHGIHTRNLNSLLGKRVKVDVEKGTPFSWEMIE